jgi:hypothetical protein
LPQLVPVKAAPAPVERTFMTREFGCTEVTVLAIRSLFTESDTRPLGVTRVEQQEINCSSGAKT